MTDAAVLDWLSDSDPALRWQVERDLAGAPEESAGQPWRATTWSLNSLREWGLDASVLAGKAERPFARGK